MRSVKIPKNGDTGMKVGRVAAEVQHFLFKPLIIGEHRLLIGCHSDVASSYTNLSSILSLFIMSSKNSRTELSTAGDYVLFSPGWHNAMDYPGVDELNEAHMELMDRPADPIVGPSYALIQILANAIEEAGSLDRDAIRDAIAATDLDTVIGHVTFREDGTGVVTPAMLQYQGGKVELVWPSEFTTADLVFPAPPLDEREAADS